MAIANPVICGCTLQEGAKLVAVVDMVKICTCIWGAITTILFALKHSSPTRTFDDDPSPLQKGLVLTYEILVGLSFVVQLFIAVSLFRGAGKRDWHKCNNWFVITSIILLLNVASFLSGSYSSFSITSTFIRIGGNGLNIVYHVYALWIVYAFMEELKNEGPLAVPTSCEDEDAEKEA